MSCIAAQMLHPLRAEPLISSGTRVVARVLRVVALDVKHRGGCRPEGWVARMYYTLWWSCCSHFSPDWVVGE